MIDHGSLLVMLLRLIDRLPSPPTPARRAGRPKLYSDKLFLKALVIMIVRHLTTPHELLAVLQQPSAEMALLRSLLSQDGKLPSCRAFERRLKPSLTPWPLKSAASAATCARCSSLGLRADEPLPSIAPCFKLGAVSGTRSIEKLASCRTVRLIPRQAGPNRAGMAGSTAGSCTSWQVWARSGCRWQPS